MSQDNFFDARSTVSSRSGKRVSPPVPPKVSEMKRYDHLFKLIIIGDPAVGKTNLTLKSCDFNFCENYLATIGIDFKVKTLEIGEKRIKLQIWDTAGQERFQSISKMYYRGAHGVLFVYDITDRLSFEHIQRWLTSYHEASGELPNSKDVTKVLVANKCDIFEERKVPRLMGESTALSHGMKYFETSAKTGHNVERVFSYIAQDIMSRTPTEERDPKQGDKSKLKQKGRSDKQKRTWVVCNLL